MRKLLLLAATITFLFFNGTFAQTVTRGPYLQSLTPTSIKIKWRTDTDLNSRVYYGTTPGNLVDFKDDPGTVRDHTIELTGLQPSTVYYYSVGTTTQVQSGPDSLHFFKTAPVTGSTDRYRFWAIGDFGKNNQGQRDVMNSCISHTANNHIDMWLWLGDCAYDNGTDSEYQTKVFDVYKDIMTYIPFYPCPGNHDYGSVCPIPCFEDPNTHDGPYYDLIDVPKNAEAGGVASGHELYYSFDYGNVHFLSLNSELGSLIGGYDWNGVYSASNFNNSPAQQWLINDLASNTLPWVVVYFHQPPYTDGSHQSDNPIELYMKAMRDNYTPIFEQYGVDIVLCGHSHVYERSFLMKGFHGSQYPTSASFNMNTHVINGTSGKFSSGEPYVKYTSGPSVNQGTVFVVNGNSGSREQGAPLNHPAFYFDDDGYGSFMMEVEGNRLDGIYLSSTGAVMDEFTILKMPYEIQNHVDVAICEGESHFAGGADQTEAGTYYDTLHAASGPDTLVITHLAVHPETPAIVKQTNTLSVPDVYASYQWYKDNTELQSETSASYVAVEDGDYFVEVGDTQGCSTFSDTLAVIIIGIGDEPESIGVQFFPNPVTDEVLVTFSRAIPGSVKIDVYNAIGERVVSSHSASFNTDKQVISMAHLQSGNYLIKVTGEHVDVDGWVVKQ